MPKFYCNTNLVLGILFSYTLFLVYFIIPHIRMEWKYNRSWFEEGTTKPKSETGLSRTRSSKSVGHYIKLK